ncbi:MAG: hypothetical protein AAGJ10_01335 [Bacteroidota bacterium]
MSLFDDYLAVVHLLRHGGAAAPVVDLRQRDLSCSAAHLDVPHLRLRRWYCLSFLGEPV